MIKKRLLSLILLITMSLGTVVNAQEITGTGYGNVPIEYSQSSTFTVILPDSIVLGSTKTQEFEVYLSNYDLIDGDKVKVTPITNTVTMENQIVEIPYLVSSEATSYQGLPEFPTYKYLSYNSKYLAYDNYILTKNSNGEYILYCILKNNEVSGANVYRYVYDNKDYYYIRSNFTKANRYYDKECTQLQNTEDYMGGLQRYIYDKITNTWVYEQNTESSSTYTLDSSNIPETEVILQSTCNINDGAGYFVQYSKTVKDPVDVTITMENEYLTDGTPIKGRVTGSDLSSGNWGGEVVFEISLVK